MGSGSSSAAGPALVREPQVAANYVVGNADGGEGDAGEDSVGVASSYGIEHVPSSGYPTPPASPSASSQNVNSAALPTSVPAVEASVTSAPVSAVGHAGVATTSAEQEAQLLPTGIRQDKQQNEKDGERKTPSSTNASYNRTPSKETSSAQFQREPGSSGSQQTKQFSTPSIPKRGHEADNFFRHMIKKYYTIKADTRIAAPRAHQNSSMGASSDAARAGSKPSGLQTGRRGSAHDSASKLHWACFEGNVKDVEQLAGAQREDEVLDSVGRTALFYAACMGHIDCCALLMDVHDEWIDVADRNGDTPLHVACCYNHKKIVKVLLESAANVHVRNSSGFAPLHVTESAGIVKLLLQFGADPMAVDKKGRTSLFCASAEKRAAVAMHFCERAADFPRLLNLADHRGDTPLHAAACNGYVHLVRLLVQSCASVGATNVRGLTPLELARQNSHHESAAVLEPHTATGTPSTSTSQHRGSTSPEARRVMHEVYHSQVPSSALAHSGWGGMSERGHGSALLQHGGWTAPSAQGVPTTTMGAQRSADSTERLHRAVQSDRSTYDANMDPGLARLMAAVGTHGESGNHEMSRLSAALSVTPAPTSTHPVNDTPTTSGIGRLMAVISAQGSAEHGATAQDHWVFCQDPASGHAYYKELRSGKTQWEAPGPNNLVNNEWKHDAINNSATPWLNVRTGLRAAQIPI